MSVVDTGGEAALAPSAACDIACVWPGPMRLGECPLWDWRQNRLLWIDSLAGRIWRLGPDDPEPAFWTLPAKIGSIALREKGGLVAALDSGFALIEEDGAEIAVTMIGDPEPDQPDTRLNDGKTDRQGRFWCGSMDSALKAPLGALYRLDADLSWHRMDEGITVSNGIAVSPDGRCLYFSDSRVDRSYRYDLDPWTGKAGNRRPFVDTTRFEGRIDGATVDAAGNYWGALFDGAAVGCFSPEGEMLRHIALPVRCPTMCSFGGPDLDTLYVTTATFMMSDDEIAAEPLAGSLLSVSGLGVRGLPETAFAG